MTIMSAPNFSTTNAKRLFVIEQEHCEDMGLWLDMTTNLCDIAMEHGFQYIDYKFFKQEVERASNNSYRDYCATALNFEWELSYKDRFGQYWTICLVPLIRSGYWEGACLDFYIKLSNANTLDLANEYVFNEKAVRETILEYMEYEEEYLEEGEDPNNIIADILNGVNDLIKQATDKFYEFAEATGLDEYAKAWQASNGEAGYINKTKLAEKALKKEAV